MLANSNGHTKLSMTDAVELSFVKNLPEEKITEKGLGSFNFKLAEELLQMILSPDCLESSVFSQLLLKIQQDNEIKHQLEAGDQEKQENLMEISNGKILDKLLLKIIQDIQNKSPKNKLSVSTLGTEIRKITGESPNSIIEKLNLGSIFLKYLKSSPTFTLKPNGKEYEVTALFSE